MLDRAHRARRLAEQGMTGHQVGWAMGVSKRTACRYIKLGRELEEQRRARVSADFRSNYMIGLAVHQPGALIRLNLTGI